MKKWENPVIEIKTFAIEDPLTISSIAYSSEITFEDED